MPVKSLNTITIAVIGTINTVNCDAVAQNAASKISNINSPNKVWGLKNPH